MRGAGMPDGIYKLADADVEVRDGRTYYGSHGGLAGSVTYMAQEVQRLREYGINEEVVLVDNSEKEVIMARTLPAILSTQRLEDRKYQYRLKVVCVSAESEWSEWTSASSDLCITPKHVKPFILQ